MAQRTRRRHRGRSRRAKTHGAPRRAIKAIAAQAASLSKSLSRAKGMNLAKGLSQSKGLSLARSLSLSKTLSKSLSKTLA